jgi:hypothetical protein
VSSDAEQVVTPEAPDVARAWIGPAAASTSHMPTGPSLRLAIAIIALFLVGLVGGIAAYAIVNAPPPTPAYPALAAAGEPQVAHDLASAMSANDVKGVADRLDPSAAQALATALQPIVEVTSVTYLGTVEQDGRDLAGYVVRGRDQTRTKQIVGLVLDVSGGQIVGINE